MATVEQGGEAHAPLGAGPVRLLELADLSKRFAAVQALDSVSFDVRGGEVHALVGENGAGKSTLAKIVGGAQRPDSGSVRLRGEEADLSSPAAALRAGVSVVYQELNLAPQLTVASNLFLAREPRGRLGFVDDRRMRTRAEELLERLGAGFSPRARVGELSPADQRLVEIARALNHDLSLIVMDEPTASLPAQNAERLFEVTDQLRRRGIAILYITHELAHVFELADRVTVLKDGQRMMTKPVAETNREEVITTMVGRDVGDLFPKRPAREARERGPALELRELTLPGYFDAVSFELHPGEVLGLGGLVGSGQAELAQSLFGVLPEKRAGSLSGTTIIDGREVTITGPRAAMRNGIGYVPADRKTAGLVLDLSVAGNISLPQLQEVSHAGLVDRREEEALAGEQVKALGIRTASVRAGLTSLSGGNQQKVVLAKWLALGSSILVLDEPTTGVDIGAKAEIYALIARLAERGTAILLVSADLPELIGLSDRILVLSKGRVVAEERRETVTEERVARAAFGGMAELQ